MCMQQETKQGKTEIHKSSCKNIISLVCRNPSGFHVLICKDNEYNNLAVNTEKLTKMFLTNGDLKD